MANADDGPMGKNKRENLTKVREQLQDMDPGQVLLKMSTICNEKNVRLVFNGQDEEKILIIPDRFERCNNFVTALQRSGDRAYDIFRQALEEVHPHLRNILPGGENLDERLLFSRIVRTNEQFSWAIRDPGVWIIFSSIDLSGPKRVECLIWPDCDIKDRLEEQESLVSRAIELRCDDSDENFNELTATIALFHNVSTLRRGQEIIIKELVNYKEKGKKPVWKDLETTCTSRQSDFLCNSCSWLGNSPFAQATINNFAVYAVVRRLKANKFPTSAEQTEFRVQDYPDVSVTIPQPYNGLSLTIKVHQLEDDKGEEGIILSPVVHLKSSQEVKRATVTIPIALCKDQRNVEDMLRSPSLEVYGYDKSQKYWDDITSKLRSELKWVKNVCSFKVHLKKDMRLHLRMKLSEQPTGPNLNSPACFDVHPVEFHARLYKLGNDKKLVLCCFPSYVNMESAMSLLNSPYPEVEMEKIFEGEAMSNVSLSNDVDLDVTFSLSHQLKYKQGEEKLE